LEDRRLPQGDRTILFSIKKTAMWESGR